MPQLVARLFGGMELRDSHGRELTLGTRKTRALLAFLIVEADRWHSRERLAALLWGGRGATQARNSLNQALHEIRKLENEVGVSIVERETDRIRLLRGSVDCDVHQFEALLTSDPLAAAELCSGALLEGVDTSNQEFSDWLGPQRAHYQEALVGALGEVASSAIDNGSIDAGIRAARRLTTLDPLDEGARQMLMRLLANSGNRAEAIRQYQICADLLKSELGITPEPATQEVLEQIKRADAEPKQIAKFAPDERLQLAETPTNDDRPVVAVLPFANLSDDADFAYFADGLAEDLIFALSAFRWFRVLARTATFRMRDPDADHREIRRMYGATYVVSGRVRRVGSRLRISVELVDCRNGQQLWAGQYDKGLDDLFDVEDEITQRLASAIEPMVEDSEMRRTLGRPTEMLAAYELLQRGYWHLYRNSQEDYDEAKRCFEAAAARDTSYAGAVAALAYLKYRDAHVNPVNNYRQRLEDSRDTAAHALELDPLDPRALRYYAGASCFLGDQDTALDAISRSIELCPSYASAYSGLAFVHDFKGNFSDAKPAADETMRLRPHDPGLYRCIMSKAIADYQTGEYERAERVARDSLRTNSSWWISNMMLMASLAQRGRLEDASAAAERIRADQPGITLEIMLGKMPFTNPAHRDHLAEGLIRAGWRDPAVA